MPGRPRKPQSLHVLEGTHRGDRQGGRAKTPTLGKPTKPRGLKGPALLFWERVVPRLTDAGIAGAADSEALARLARWHAIELDLLSLVESGEYDMLPALANASKQWLALASRFGLTPLDRGRIDRPIAHDDTPTLNVRPRQKG